MSTTPDISYVFTLVMTFNWQSYLERAKKSLCEIPKDAAQGALPPEFQAPIRDSISRTYYAVHNIARQFAEKEVGGELKTEHNKGIHDAVIKHFRDLSNSDRQRISNHLTQLKEDRVKADYKESAEIRRSTAELNIAFAEQILERLKKLSTRS